jgi:hypothetical protein
MQIVNVKGHALDNARFMFPDISQNSRSGDSQKQFYPSHTQESIIIHGTDNDELNNMRLKSHLNHSEGKYLQSMPNQETDFNVQEFQ